MDFAVIWRYRADLIAIAVLVILWTFFFWRLITPVEADQLVIEPNGDMGSHYYNFSSYHAARFTEGEWMPLWNPYNYGGSPFLADPQSVAAYPLRWLFLIFYAENWNYFAIELEVMAHVLIASLLMYAFARRMTGQVLGGMVGALAFAYGTYVHSFPIQQLTVLTTLVWLPLVMLGIYEGTRPSASWRWFLLSGIGMGLSFLGGHPQMAMGTGYFAAAYLSFRVYTGTQSWRQWITGGLLMGGFGAGIGAIMLLPAAEFIQITSRAEDFSYTSKGVGYFFQNIFQALWTVPGLSSYWYIGVVLLPLIGLAVYHQPEQARFWLGAALLMLIIGFGTKTSLFQAFYVFLPGFSMFRNPERYLVIWSFSLATLAALGTSTLFQPQRRELRWLLWAGVGVAATYFILIYNSTGGEYDQLNKEMAGYTLLVMLLVAILLPLIMQHKGRQPLLIGLIVFDLFSVSMGHSFNYRAGLPETILPANLPPAWITDIKSLLVENPFHRIDSTNKLGSAGTLYSVPDLNGASPLRLKNTLDLLNLPVTKRWELLGVRYVISGEAPLPVPAEQLPYQHQDFTGAALHIYQLTDPRPLALITYGADIFAEDAQALQVISAPDYPIRERVVLPEFAPIALPEQPGSQSVEVETWEPEKLQLSVTTSENGLLVIAIPYHPGWSAQVDEKNIQVLRADVGLMAVPVLAGSHTVSLTFAPSSVRIGAGISVITWLITIILFCMPLLRWSTKRQQNVA